MPCLSYDSLIQLHTSLYSRFQKYNLNLQTVVETESVAGLARNGTSVIAYLRPANEAQTVEAMMGRDLPNRRLDLRRHPAIELRATAEGVALELILPPDAWWDQQNFVGKLAIERHRSAFRRLIGKLDDNFCLGFWGGMQLDPMHLVPKQASNAAVFEPWIATFCHGQDWFRVGVWYDDIGDNLTNELFRNAQSLYELYTFISWTGNNDFRAFQDRAPAFAYA